MKNGILLIGAVSIAMLGYLFGNHLSSEAMAVAVGVLCGITASIPISLALFIAVSRNWGHTKVSYEEPASRTPRKRAAQPRVLVINPPQINQAPYHFQPNPIYMPQNMLAISRPREFKIVGDD